MGGSYRCGRLTFVFKRVSEVLGGRGKPLHRVTDETIHELSVLRWRAVCAEHKNVEAQTKKGTNHTRLAPNLLRTDGRNS